MPGRRLFILSYLLSDSLAVTVVLLAQTLHFFYGVLCNLLKSVKLLVARRLTCVPALCQKHLPLTNVVHRLVLM
jgi:hypothetical protein